MDTKLHDLLSEAITPNTFVSLILSHSRRPLEVMKAKLRPILLKGAPMIQAERFCGKQVFHANMTYEETLTYLEKELEETFMQAEITELTRSHTILISKKGTVTVKTRHLKPNASGMVNATANAAQALNNLSHNKTKSYILPEGTPVPYLVELGVMTPQGRVVHARYDKFRQINRFLEFIRDVVPYLPTDRQVRILDFGCGRSYLTFAVYDYLKYHIGLDVHILGLDLKQSVIEDCSALAKKLHYDDLEFRCGDVADYAEVDAIDLMITLHACDLATDYALAYAVSRNARVILSVPCCQHELNKQIRCDALSIPFSYGLIKERTAALFTDSIRASVLSAFGYEAQILEFIDTEHTPKNILIRAMKQDNTPAQPDAKKLQEVRDLCAFLGVEPTLLKLLGVEASEA